MLMAYPRGKDASSYVIPSTVKTIIAGAFAGEKNLKEVTIPASVEKMGNGVFENCTNLTTVSMQDPKMGLDMPEATFKGCTPLTEIVVGDGYKSIGKSAFEGCKALTLVDIPMTVGSIGEDAFAGCETLKDVRYSGSAAAWEDVLVYGGNQPLQTATLTTGVHRVKLAEPVETTPDTRWLCPPCLSLHADGKCRREPGGVPVLCAEGCQRQFRDLANILNGTAVQFQVSWEDGVTITTQEAYTPNGTEQNAPFSGERPY